jgi:hypothetical protein
MKLSSDPNQCTLATRQHGRGDKPLKRQLEAPQFPVVLKRIAGNNDPQQRLQGH